jgi:transposase-like protein
MERRSKYSSSDRAVVYAALEANEGNIKRTARETGYAISTVRDWKTKWEREGVEQETVDALPAVVGDFVDDATRVRNKLLMRLEQLADKGELTGREIVPALGMLTDKIRAYKGLDNVKEHHHVVEVPALAEMQARLETALGQLVNVGQRRQQVLDEVVDLEPSQYRELQPAQGE